MDMEIVTYNEAKNAYEKFVKESKGFLGFFGKNDELQSFADIQKGNSAYNGVYLGIKTVPLDKIKGSVQKYMDFDQNFVPKNNVIEDRWSKIYMAFVNGKSLPPVSLYKIKNDYFVYDGNHRISVTKFLKQEEIESEVTEFLPSSETKENVIYREKFIFEKTTDLDGVIFTETNQYPRLIKEITDYKEYLLNKEGKDLTFLETSQLWNQNIYLPSVKIMKENNLLQMQNFPNRTLADLFVYFLDHKYYESEKKGHDIGFSYAIVDYINLIKTDKDLESKIILDEKTIKNLKILNEVDKRKYLDPEILRKNDILKESTGLSLNHNFLLLFEIDDYIEKNNITDYKEGLKKWYDENFIKKIEILQKKVEYLPEIYSDKIDMVLKDKEKLFYSLQNYNIICQNTQASCLDLLANYIIQIYIPIIDILVKKSIGDEQFIEAYYGIQGKYNYLLEYKKDVTIKEASELYFKSEGKKYQKIHDWFLDKFNNTSKSEILIDYMIGKVEMGISDIDLFRKTLEKYGKPKKYGTVFKLEMAKDNFMEANKEKDWLRDRIIPELENMSSNEEIMIFFKTKSVLAGIKGKEELSLIDFYADVVDYGNYLGKNLNEVAIIDLALDYKNK